MADRGRPKGMESPEIMWELFERYREYVKANPFIIEDWVGQHATLVKRKKEKPLTMVGYECYCFSQGYNTDLSRYFANTGGAYAEYVHICNIIRDEIRNDQIGGGMAGIYNASITQRLNGLTDKLETRSDTKLSGDINISFDIT